jgi:hypothetical protein
LHERLRSLVLTMAAKKAIFFMDGPTLRVTQERLDLAIASPIIIPLSSDTAWVKPRAFDRDKGQRPIRFVWLGRLCDFKIHILVHAARRLSELARKHGISMELHIIGDGPEGGRLDQLALDHPGFRLVKLGVLCGKERDEYLLLHADVMLAMGMAACDGAKLGIPTVLLDFSYAPISRNYRFRWLFDSKDYSLGDVIMPEHYENGNDSLNEILNEVINNYHLLASRTFDYYSRHHSLSAVCEKFAAALSSADFRYGSIGPEVRQKGLVRRGYEFVRDDVFKAGVFASKE